LKVLPLNSQIKNSPSWLTFSQREKSLFYSEQWQAIYADRDLRICVILNNNEDVIGVFQYLVFEKLIFKMAITPPFCPSIGLHYINPGESVVGRNSFTKELLTAVAAYFAEQGHDLVDLALPAEIQDTQPFTWKGMRSVLRYSYWIDLKQTEEELWKKLSGEKRKSVTKAEKDALIIERSEDFPVIADLIVASLERNKALKNEELIRRIISDSMKDQVIAFTARHGGELLAATFCVKDTDKVIYLFGGTAATNRHHGAGVACMWRSILFAKQSGAHVFDFEGSMQPGIEKYFREFGGDLISYAAIEKSGLLLSLLMKLRKR